MAWIVPSLPKVVINFFSVAMLTENVTLKLIISVLFIKLKPPYNENIARYAHNLNITAEIVT